MNKLKKIGSVGLLTLGCAFLQTGLSATSAAAATLTAGFPTTYNANEGFYVPYSDDKVVGGTGNINVFLAMQDGNDPGNTESGFNTDATVGTAASQPEVDNAKTKSVTLSELISSYEARDFVSFTLDVNEPNSPAGRPITLTSLQLYYSQNAALTSLASATLFFDASGVNKALSDGTGSGALDYLFLIPTIGLPNPVRNNPSNYFIHVFASFADAQGGFEEFGELGGTTTIIPTPALLPGLVGLGFGMVRKRKKAATAEAEA